MSLDKIRNCLSLQALSFSTLISFFSLYWVVTWVPHELLHTRLPLLWTLGSGFLLSQHHAGAVLRKCVLSAFDCY